LKQNTGQPKQIFSTSCLNYYQPILRFWIKISDVEVIIKYHTLNANFVRYPSLVSSVDNSTFSSRILISEREIATNLTNQLLRNGSVAISIYFISQLYLSAGPIDAVIHLTATVAVLSALSGFLLANKFDRNWIILLSNSVLLFIPIFIDPYVDKAWISYGFLIAVFIFIAVMQENIVFATTILLFSLAWHYVVASFELTGIIDNQDILLLGSYFSTSWLIVFGVGLIFARRSYFHYCDQIDEQLFNIQDSLSEQSKSLSQLNLKDYRNIVIHGTVLNTLISYKNTFETLPSQSSLANQLTADLAKIDSIEYANRNPVELQELLKSNLDSYGLKISFDIPSNLRIEKDVTENLLEIIREIVLNTKKHTDSKLIKISITELAGVLNLRISEIFPANLATSTTSMRIRNARSSATLDRLIKSALAQLSIDIPATSDRLNYNIQIPLQLTRIEATNKVGELRRKSLTRMIYGISIISLMYTLLALPGFFYLNVPIYINLSILAIALIMITDLQSKNKTQWRPILLQVIALALIPMTFIDREICNNLLYTPWLFNTIFGSILFATYFLSNPILKWSPGILFIFESFGARFIYPQECKTLLDGSTPGFLLILLFAYSLGRARTRNLVLDNQLEFSIESQNSSSLKTSTLVDIKRASLILELEKFVQNLKNNTFADDQIFQEIDIWIQKLRAFLICSEHYGSDLVQKIYDFMINRLAKRENTRISIYTGEIPSNSDLDSAELTELDKKATGVDVELIITDQDKLTLEFYADKKLLKAISIAD
jgi:hypothetical protein